MVYVNNHMGGYVMTTTIRLSDRLVNDARNHAVVESRCMAKHIKYWAMMGKIALKNLPVAFIKETLIADQEAKNGQVTP